MVRALIGHLPHESLIYVGDTARVPYGPKSASTVQKYSLQISRWLIDQGAKAIVVACNTATAHALEMMVDTLEVPVIGVIQPGARAAVAASPNGNIGVIGTRGTVNSGAYKLAIQALSPNAVVHSQACPMLVPLVEEGWVDHPVAREVVREYLRPMQEFAIDTLVLGCTHYPLIAPLIAEEIGGGVRLIDSAEETAKETAALLADDSLLASEEQTAMYRWVASDAPDHFFTLGQRFLGRAISKVEHVGFG